MRHRLYGGVRGSLCKGALYSILYSAATFLVPGQSLEVYLKLSLGKAQETYDENIKDFPV